MTDECPTIDGEHVRQLQNDFFYNNLICFLFAWEKTITYKNGKRKSSNIHEVKRNLVENINTNSPK